MHMSIRYNEEFHRAKESLLKYYSDIQVSLGARLIGLSVALFALVEAFLFFLGKVRLPVFGVFQKVGERG